MQICKKYHFYAAHRNLQADEKCARIHGHTYDVSCYLQFNEPSQLSGVCMLFSEIDKIIEPLIKQHCHYLLLYSADPLCEVLRKAGEQFFEVPFATSCENLAKYFFELIQQSGLPIAKIALQETKSATIIYDGHSKQYATG
jgi:6-pyruvoyltetrahydropterin/6-carboxytetrahydropterin synthase